MFLIILLILVIVFYPYTEHFTDLPSIQKLHDDFDDVFKNNRRSIRDDPDSYMNLYTNLNN